MKPTVRKPPSRFSNVRKAPLLCSAFAVLLVISLAYHWYMPALLFFLLGAIAWKEM